AKLKASAVRKGDKITITAEVLDVAEPGDKLRLRMALGEDAGKYKGSNGVPGHIRVGRGLPGGPEGVPGKNKTAKGAGTGDLDELKQELAKYLADLAKKVPLAKAPLDLEDLRVVVFLQDDATREVLQAVEVPVPAAKGKDEK